MSLVDIDKSRVVDADTGEVLHKHTVLRKSNEVVKVFDASTARKNVKHVKLRIAREQKRTYMKLTLEERGFLFSVLPYMEWESNILISDETGKPLSWAKVDGIVGISKHTRIKIVRSLEDKRVIGYIVIAGKKRGIVVNPAYAIRGRKPKDALKAVFEYDGSIEDDYS
jgi:hypothetical protein